MNVDLVTLSDLEKFKEELLKEISDLIKKRVDPPKKWIKTEEAKSILGCSAGTLHTLRYKGILEATKVGGTVYFSMINK